MSEVKIKNRKEILPCGDANFQRLCWEYSDRLPCCDAVCRNTVIPRFNKFKDGTKILWNKINCADLFELKEDLLNCGYFREIKGVGWSMFPTIRNGDLLKTIPCKIEDLEVTDIAVYRSGDKLCAHRVIDKKVINGKSYLVTRRDASAGPGENIDGKDLLVKVAQIKRGHKILSTEKRKATVWDKFLYKKTRVFLILTTLFKKILKTVLAKVQTLRLYEALAKKLVERMRPYLNFELAIPFSSEKLNRLYNRKPLKDNKRFDSFKLREVKIFHLVIKFNKIPLGYASILNRPGFCPYRGFWMGEVYIRLRYRGLGLDSILLSKAKKFFKKVHLGYIINKQTGDGNSFTVH